MKTFYQFFEEVKFHLTETRNDQRQLRGMGFRGGMQVRQNPIHRLPSQEEVEEAEYLVVQAPQDATANIKQFNGQIVVRHREFDSNDGSRLGVAPLTGRHEEGNAYRIEWHYLRPASEEEIAHGKYLGDTFFHRDEYISPTDHKPKIVDVQNPVMRNTLRQLEQCKTPQCQGMLQDLRNNPYHDTWAIAADLLDDNGIDTTELRKVLNNQD